MFYPLPPVIPTRPPTAVKPIAEPGTYTARLTVDGVVQESQFELKINPKERYAPEETAARFAMWMDVYGSIVDSTNNVIAALELRDSAAARVDAMKSDGASAADIAEAERNAAVIAEAANEYEAIFVSTGRTLAEVVNLPPKIFTKMVYLSDILVTSEGPPPKNIREQFERLQAESDQATAAYQSKIQPAIAALGSLADQ